jgi:transposase
MLLPARAVAGASGQDALLGVEGIHVCSVTAAGTGLVLHVETAETVSGCPDCGVVAIGHGRRQVRLHDTPCFGRPVRLLWAKRVWRCPDPDCPRTTFTEEHELAGPRAKLTARAVAWATDGLQRFDTSVSALAHQLGVSWHTAWDAIKAEAARRIAAAGRLTGVDALGVDEHVWSHTGPPGTGMVTGIVDHTRDAHGVVHARLLDLVPGRSGKAYADWLKDRGEEFTAGIKTAALDPFRGYANAIRDELPEAITVLDAFHVVKLGSAMVDEVRRRVQQDTLGHRGRKGDPLYGIRRTLQIGAEHLTTNRPPGSTRSSPSGTRTTKSPWPGSATRSSATSTTPGPPGQGTRQRGDRFIPVLPDPRGLTAGPDAQTMEGCDPGLLRHQRRLQRPY